MKKASKIISVFMVAIMTLSIFAVSASAVATPLVAGNTKETATTIPNYGVEYTSELSKAGEQDWFKFTTLSQDAYYTITLENYNIYEPTGNTYHCLNLFVYDSSNGEVVHITNPKYKDVKLETNTTYYIKVHMGSANQNATGNYEILISYKLDPVADTKDNATTINVNTTYKYSLDGTNDSDWYKFTAPADDTYKISLENYNIYEPTGSYYHCLNLYVYDQYNKEIAHIYNPKTQDVKLEKNVTYYILVTMGSSVKATTGNYGFFVNCNYTKTLSKIIIDSMPAKTTYAIGESFDQTGLEVTAHYSDGSTKAVTSCTVYGFDSSKAGTNTVTISYTENGVTKTATFDVTITDTSTPATGFDFMSILTAIWDAIVWLFNFLMGLVGAV